MSNGKNQVITPQLFSMFNDMRKEFHEAILRVEGKVDDIGKSFNDFEKGRVSKLENDLISLKEKHNSLEQDTYLNRKILYGGIAIIVITVITAIVKTVIIN